MIVAELFAKLGLQVDKGSWQKGHQLINGIGGALAAFIGYKVIRGIIDATESTIELGSHLVDLKQKTGLSAAALQQYGFAAKENGSDMDSFAHGVMKLSRTFQEAKDGSAQASKALRDAGLTSQAVTAAMAGGDGLDAALMEIADKFADMPDGPKKTALAMQLFGRAGAELIPTLNKGGDGLRELRDEAEDLGIVLGDDAVNAAKEMEKSTGKLGASITGLKNQAVAALLPLMQSLVNSVLAWVKANRQLIIDTVTTAVEGLITVLGYLAKGVGVVVDIIQFFREHMELTEDVLLALGLVLAAFAIEAAAAWIAAFLPVILVIAAIAAVIFAIRYLIKHWEDIKRIAGQVWSWVVDKVKAAGKAIFDALMWPQRKLIEGWEIVGKAIVAAIKAAYDYATSLKWARAIPVLGWLGEQLGKGAGFIASHAPGVSSAADNDAYSQAVAGGQFSGSRSDFEAQTQANMGATQANANIAGGPREQNVNVTNTYGDVNVTSNSADPKEVADQVKQQIDQHWNGQMRDAYAGSGAP